MSGLVLGVDIGVVGAIAVLSHAGELVSVHDMPVLADGPAGRRSVNAPLLAEIILKCTATAAYVEYVSARPKEGGVGAFAFGRARGVTEGVLAGAGLPVTFLTPQVWKRVIGIPPGKDGAKDLARSEAIRRWPAHAGLFARVKDDGRAEAALIAIAGIAREARR
jgi:crossover junction endodeoxyribonuclease RuvC